MTKAQNKLSSVDRLKSTKRIGLLTHCESAYFYPVKVYYHASDMAEKQLLQSAFTVPKKLFHSAVHRNKLRRRMKEAYRLQKNKFEWHGSLEILWVYIGRKQEPYHIIFDAFAALLIEIRKNYQVEHPNL